MFPKAEFTNHSFLINRLKINAKFINMLNLTFMRINQFAKRHMKNFNNLTATKTADVRYQRQNRTKKMRQIFKECYN